MPLNLRIPYVYTSVTENTTMATTCSLQGQGLSKRAFPTGTSIYMADV